MKKGNYFCLVLMVLMVLGPIVFALEMRDPITGKVISGEAITDYPFDCGEAITDYPFDYAKESIKQKAIDVAKQVEIYLESHPEKTIEELQKDLYFQEIAVQGVGETGYTAVTDYDNLVAKFHKNPKIIGIELETLKDKLPGFWKIMSQTQGGVAAEGTYDWEEADGSVRQKYMYIAVVQVKTSEGVGLHVAATTYLDEYKDVGRGGLNSIILIYLIIGGGGIIFYLLFFLSSQNIIDKKIKTYFRLFIASAFFMFVSQILSLMLKILIPALFSQRILYTSLLLFVFFFTLLYIRISNLNIRTIYLTISYIVVGVISGIIIFSKLVIEKTILSHARYSSVAIVHGKAFSSIMFLILFLILVSLIYLVIGWVKGKDLKKSIVIFILLSSLIIINAIYYLLLRGTAPYLLLISPIILCGTVGFILFGLGFLQQKKNVVLYILVISLLLVVGLFVFNTYQTAKDLERSAIESYNEQQLLLAKHTAEDIESIIEIIIRDALTTATEPGLVSGIEEENYDVLDRMYGRLNVYTDSIYLLDTEGNGIARVPYEEGYLQKKKDYREKSGVSEALASQEVKVSELFKLNSGENAISTLVPVMDEQGFKGLIRMNILLSTIFNEYLESGKGHEKVDHVHLIIGNQIYISANESTSAPEEIISNTKEGKPGEYFGIGPHYVESEKEILASYYPIDLWGGYWGVFVESERESVTASISKSSDQIWFFTAGVIISIILIGFVFNYLLTRSLRKEIGEKTIQLKEFNKELEGTVLERTREVARKSKELEKLNLDLGKEVQKRTGELDQKILDLSSTKKALMNMMEDTDKVNEELKKLDKSKSEFLNIVSHELKTPLTAIIAYLDVLADARKNPSPEEVESLEAISRNSRSLKRLIGNILEIARMESGKFELIKQKTDVNLIIEETLKDIKSIADRKKLKLINNIKGIPEMELDTERFREVIINLTGNAIKFTKKGSITISGEIKKEIVEFKIVDTGVGIPESHINELFNKFYQVDASISRKYGGTGLGLAITKKIIEAHGGEIRVKSVEGKGTQFIFHLPINDVGKISKRKMIKRTKYEGRSK